MTAPNLTPRVDTLTDARLTAFRNAIAHELTGTPLADLRLTVESETRRDFGALFIRARTGVVVGSAVELDDLAVDLGGDAYLDAHATRMGANMRHEWEKLTGAIERRRLVDDIRRELLAAIAEPLSGHETRNRRIESALAQLDGLAR